MFTASHNPASYNGIKFSRAGARGISLDTGLAAIRDRAIAYLENGIDEVETPGTFREMHILVQYASYLRELVSLASIRPLKVVVDAGNGMGGLTVPAVLGTASDLERLPLEIIPMYFELDGTFPNHEANPLDPKNLVDLQKAVVEHGADIVVQSLTKYLGGHGTSLGGAIIDSGKFPWAQHKARFKRLNEPDPSYHGVVYTEALGPAAYIGRARVVPLRNTGAAISPFNAFLILQGIETLALRMDRINSNSLAVAQFLQQHPKVGWVNYAGLPDHPDHALAQKYLGGKASGLLTFGVRSEAGQGRAAGARFLDALGLFTRLVNIGDAKSLATHPASTTHRQLSPEELVKSGVPEDAVRLSIGIEHIDDLLADLDQALAAV